MYILIFDVVIFNIEEFLALAYSMTLSVGLFEEEKKQQHQENKV
jgi:hypothetical protein